MFFYCRVFFYLGQVGEVFNSVLVYVFHEFFDVGYWDF